jgi:hypothetical protein
MFNKARSTGRRGGLALGLLFLAGAAVSLATCGNDARDCGYVCNRWRDCVNASYDVPACQSKCEDKAGKDRDFDAQLEHCATCAQGRSCSETGAACLTSCIGVVP